MSDKSLTALQSWMQNALIFPGGVSGEDVGQIVKSSSRMSAAQGLAIYQRSYYLRILKCMAEQFPALCYALGKSLFTSFARQYLEDQPPQSYTLNDLGKRFPDYLEKTRPDRHQAEEDREIWVDFMVDLARFEQQLFVMFDASGLEGKSFAALDTPDNRLGLQPCFALGNYRFPVAWYYYEVRRGNDPPLPSPEKSFVATVRKEYVTHTFPLTALQSAFLTALEQGKSVEDAFGLVAVRSAESIGQLYETWSKIDGLRKRWIEAGFFVAKD